MALNNIDLSDIGKTLIAIEAEIKSNQDSIQYYHRCISEYKNKNEALAKLADTLLMNVIPLTYKVEQNG